MLEFVPELKKWIRWLMLFAEKIKSKQVMAVVVLFELSINKECLPYGLVNAKNG